MFWSLLSTPYHQFSHFPIIDPNAGKLIRAKVCCTNCISWLARLHTSATHPHLLFVSVGVDLLFDWEMMKWWHDYDFPSSLFFSADPEESVIYWRAPRPPQILRGSPVITPSPPNPLEPYHCMRYQEKLSISEAAPLPPPIS